MGVGVGVGVVGVGVMMGAGRWGGREVFRHSSKGGLI